MCGVSRQLVLAAHLLVVAAACTLVAAQRPNEQLLCQLQDQQSSAAWSMLPLQHTTSGTCPADFTPTETALNTTDAGSLITSRVHGGMAASAASSWETVIVRFTKYKMVWEHKLTLLDALGHLQEYWVWLDRHNKAAATFPSDFALLLIARPRLNELRDVLKQVTDVRDMHPDRRIRGLKEWQPQGQLAALFSDSIQQDQQAKAKRGPLGLRLQHTTAGDSGTEQQTPTRQILGDEGQPNSSDAVNDSQEQQQQQQQRMEGNGSEDDAESVWTTSKPPGRFTTRPTIGLDPRNPADRAASQGKEELKKRRSLLTSSRMSWGFKAGHQRGRRLAGPADNSVTTLLEAKKLWDQGYSGKGIKVGVFDTGIREGHPHIRNIKERTNWTHQNSLSDGLGHGSFVAGVIGSQDSTCPGFAPDVELYTFKVFTDDQVSYTSWFLDAFNYAIASKLTVINLSIGGPDFLDAPFVEKVLEVTSNGLIMISAIGNDGPLYGTLNNPADQPDVIGVGGIDNNNNIASFSSRGMTTWELPQGTGRIKPDVMAYAKEVTGSKIQSGCRSLSGTSVASPVVAGAVCLLASTVPEEKRWMLNPASMKQALVEGAVRLPSLNMHEQGNGRINLPASQAILAEYTPRASLIPAAINLSDCPYMWPHCKQGLYAFGLPVMLNAAVVNGMANVGKFDGQPVYEGTNGGGKLLHVTFQHSEVLWPWSGYLGIFIEVSPAAWNFSGNATGTITFTIKSPPLPGAKTPQISKVVVPLSAMIIPTPPRNKRIIWDVLHSIKYPPGYVPRDNLDIKSDVLDWHGDHPYTNFHDAFDALRNAGFFVEVMHSPGTCFDPANYGAYLLLDSEEEWYKEEITALEAAVKEHGMALVVFAEWYHEESLKQMKFFDDNTRSWWTPITGGANVPALNELLAPHQIVLGERIVHGRVTIGNKHNLELSYGANIAAFPAGGYLHVKHVNDVSGKGSGVPGDYAVFGVATSGKGQVAVLGDSNCLDSSHNIGPCHTFLVAIMQHLLLQKDKTFTPDETLLSEPYKAAGFVAAPKRRADVNFTQYSWVLSHPLTCHNSAPCQFRQPSDCPSGSEWKHKHLQPGSEPEQAVTRLPTAVASDKLDHKVAKTAGDAVKPAQQESQVQRQQQHEAEEQLDREDEMLAEEEQQDLAAGDQGSTVAADDSKEQRIVADEEDEQLDTAAVHKQQGEMDVLQQQQHMRHNERHSEHMQQGQRKAFLSQAVSLATFICIAGVVGVVVLWRMRSSVAPRAKWVRKWGSYAPVRARTAEV